MINVNEFERMRQLMPKMSWLWAQHGLRLLKKLPTTVTTPDGQTVMVLPPHALIRKFDYFVSTRFGVVKALTDWKYGEVKIIDKSPYCYELDKILFQDNK